jgi:hypothetical protein
VRGTFERAYRLNAVVEGDLRVVLREETFDRTGDWVQRGSEATESGRAGEAASRIMTERKMKSPAAGETYLAMPRERLRAPEGGGGFDEVYIKFRTDAEGNVKATVIIVEVKHYPKGGIALDHFTAIGENLQQNYLHIHGEFTERLAALRTKMPDLTAAQAAAVVHALETFDIEFEIRASKATGLGAEHKKSSTIMRDLRANLQAEFDLPIPVKRIIIDDDDIADGLKLAKAAGDDDRIGKPTAFRRLASPPGLPPSPDRVRAARTAVLAERTDTGLGRTLAATDDPHVFVDATNNRYRVVELPRLPETSHVRRFAEELRTALLTDRSTPKDGTKPTTMLVDVTNLTQAQRDLLWRSLRSRLGRDAPMLSRIYPVDAARATVGPPPPVAEP